MNNLKQFQDLLNKSKVSLIGYNIEDKRDNFLLTIPHIKLYSIEDHLNLLNVVKKIERNSKIKSLIEVNSDTCYPNQFLVIDLNDLRDYYNWSPHPILRSIVEQFRNSKYKLIFTSPTYKTPNNTINYIGGVTPLYLSDVALNIDSDGVNIHKSRF